MAFTIIRKAVQIIRHSLFVSWLLYISICITLIIYYWFYTWYVPKAQISSDVIFELQHPNNHDYRTNSQYELIASVDLVDDSGQFLHSGQEYTFTLNLDVPESDSNFDIGIFGISADILNVENRKTASFKTTSTLKYKSSVLRYALTFFQLPFFLFWNREQKQTLNIVLKENYIDNTYLRASRIVIRIHEKLQFYSAKLDINAKFSGFKYYLHHWYFSTSFLICSLLIMLTFLILLTNFYDVKSFLLTNLFMNKKPKDENSDDKMINIYKGNEKNYAFIATTTRELKYFLDYDRDANIIIGIENFRRLPSSIEKKELLCDK